MTATARGPYDPRLDLNTDGLIEIADLRVALLRHGSALPTGQPIVRNSFPAIATDVVFERLAAAAPPPAAIVSESVDRAADESPLVNSTDQALKRRHARRRRAITPDLNVAITPPHSRLGPRIARARRRGVDLN